MSNDFQMRAGDVAADPNMFGNDWKVHLAIFSCDAFFVFLSRVLRNFDGDSITLSGQKFKDLLVFHIALLYVPPDFFLGRVRAKG